MMPHSPIPNRTTPTKQVARIPNFIPHLTLPSDFYSSMSFSFCSLLLHSHSHSQSVTRHHSFCCSPFSAGLLLVQQPKFRPPCLQLLHTLLDAASIVLLKCSSFHWKGLLLPTGQNPDWAFHYLVFPTLSVSWPCPLSAWTPTPRHATHCLTSGCLLMLLTLHRMPFCLQKPSPFQ